MARKTPALDLPLHAYFRLLAQCRRGLLRQTHQQAPPARRVPIGRRARNRHRALHRRGQCRTQTLPLDRAPKPHPRSCQTWETSVRVSPLAIEISSILVRDAAEVERAIAALAKSGNGGLIVTPNAGVSVHRDLIIELAARHSLPAVYGTRSNVNSGGLIFYGPNRLDQFRRAAAYVDRVLRGEKPADLPVQAPTKYDLVINLKAAKAL